MTDKVYLEKYRAIRPLGEGGMGQVFLGEKLIDKNEVVIKVMHEQFASNPRFLKAFQREMLLMMQFRHPYAVELYDASLQDQSDPCIVMEYVRGITLAELLERHGRLPPLRVGQLLSQLAQVLYSAHENGIMHRDLTLVNIMLTNPDTPNETIKVMDFGLARMGAAPYFSMEKLTGESQSIGGGTPDYVPPEQIRGEEVDHRGDIYSLGVVLYKLLTGYLPFEKATTTTEILQAHLHEQAPRFAEVGVRAAFVSPAVEAVVKSCLAKHPGDRPQTALDLLKQYEAALGVKLLTSEPIKATVSEPQSAADHADPRSIMGRLEAMMLEPIALIKLKGFAFDMGGKVIDSEPGMIRFRLPDPTSIPEEQPKDWLSRLGLKKKNDAPPEHILVELLMEKNKAGPQEMLRMTVMMTPENQPERITDTEWRQYCQSLCVSLRGYLIGM